MSEDFNETDMQRIMEQSETILPEKKCRDCGKTMTFNPIRYYGGYGCQHCD